ncbi:MAG: SpoIIE family protein phosphatase [Salinivirgaceae bacterium]|jgi:sigma-B regulation protein RsbU (phosphoserine phosphatase)|nr:SpoIIE family protein phosphatase [Salinivirgaceae bacterium]
MVKCKLYLVFILSYLSIVVSAQLTADNSLTSINKEINGIDSSKGAWWYGSMAKEKYENEQYDKAIIDYTKAIILDADVAEFYYYRGNAFAIVRQGDKALNDFKKALELNPDYLSALTNMGWDYLKQGEYKAALRHFTEFLKLIRNNPRRIISMGINARFLEILSELGWQSMRNDELPKALRYFNNYIELAPKDPDAYLGLALVYFKYNDSDNALSYLDKAKSLEPALYQGSAGIAALEQSGCFYSEYDLNLIQSMFGSISNKMHDLQNITTSSTWKLLIGFMYLVLGMVAFIIFALRIKKSEGFIFYLGLLNISFGLNLLYDNPLIQLTDLPSPVFWSIALPMVVFIVPVAFILFIRYFIGWGWRYSILLLLIYSVIQGVFRVFADFTQPAQEIYGTTNTIFGFLAVVVLFLHLFLPDMRKNREVQIIGAGLGFYLLALFYNNLAKIQWLPERLSFDDPAYFFFNICLIYVAFRRIANTEKEFFAVKKDLETARKIQNAILPDQNPKGETYEVSAAYLPMALIGGDYYDYQMHDNLHIGLLIADVSGHGISAALIASMLKVAFTAQVQNARNPAIVLQQINLSLNGQLNNEFITAGYLGIDLANKELTYSSAGHPPMVLHRRKTDKIEEVKVAGIPIGVLDDMECKEINMKIESGDRLVLYTDGILEVFNSAGEAMGKNRFMDLIIESKNLFVEDATENIIEKINAWSEKDDGETHEDDITLVIFDVL